MRNNTKETTLATLCCPAIKTNMNFGGSLREVISNLRLWVLIKPHNKPRNAWIALPQCSFRFAILIIVRNVGVSKSRSGWLFSTSQLTADNRRVLVAISNPAYSRIGRVQDCEESRTLRLNIKFSKLVSYFLGYNNNTLIGKILKCLLTLW